MNSELSFLPSIDPVSSLCSKCSLSASCSTSIDDLDADGYCYDAKYTPVNYGKYVWNENGVCTTPDCIDANISGCRFAKVKVAQYTDNLWRFGISVFRSRSGSSFGVSLFGVSGEYATKQEAINAGLEYLGAKINE